MTELDPTGDDMTLEELRLAQQKLLVQGIAVVERLNYVADQLEQRFAIPPQPKPRRRPKGAT